MVVGCTTTYAIIAYQHQSCEFEFCSWRGVLDTTLCDKVCQWLGTGQWFSPGTLVFSTNKTDRHESGVKHHNPNPLKYVYVISEGVLTAICWISFYFILFCFKQLSIKCVLTVYFVCKLPSKYYILLSLIVV